MARGITRKLDEVGRVTIPIEMRRETGIDCGVRADLYLADGVICLKKGNGRKVDELGRYVLPMELRRAFGWEPGQVIEMYVEGDVLHIRKDGCEWCDESSNLIEVNGHKLCPACISKIVKHAACVMEGIA